ncbi:T9SS type A sorting domain-containing protein [Pseudoflavitalea sp. X16]|uniref:DUF6055 domain-containing protein n=1 Tax=Paraflavitalea devenefica TaxID=2716334 RepID=UPI00142395ED|nr:DUF6055 domain-containing protein [Paraflavitalea devenefica]NII28830.1 T9SS type A sorting domain-containing protein [Paraflavitalea devenefica]
MRYFYAIVCLCLALQASAQKQVYIPRIFSTDPALSTWSYNRSVQSENFVCFWGPVVGEHPETYTDPNLRFTPAQVLDTLEKIYDKFVHGIRFCKDDSTTNLGKYKIIVVINDTWPPGGPTGWAFGSSYDEVIGAMWVHPGAVRDGAVLSHELTHSLQGQNNIDRNLAGGFRNQSTGSFWETHANFMRLQLYPQFAKEDVPRWMATRSFQYSSTRHHYCAFNLLLTIQELDSLGMVNRLWQESAANEHPLMTYRRLKGWTQSQLNDFIWEYAKRDVIADYNVLGTGAYIRAELRRLQNAEPHYLWRQYTLLKRVNDSLPRYVVPDYHAPQDYGYNIIPLHPTCANRMVKVKFKGHAEAAGAGWRYGFVAVKADGKTARYSASYTAPEGEVTFAMQEDETALYLVVSGAPSSHTTYVWEAGFPKIKRFPYEISIANAVPEGYQTGYRDEFRSAGHIHANGGGWVSNSATVDASVYVGPKAIVRGSSRLTGNVRIEGTAWVENAVLSDNVVVSGNAQVFGGTLSGSVQVTDNAILSYCTVSGNVIAKDNALEWGVTLGNGVVVGGDAEIGSCSSTGVYLQTPNFNNGRAECDGKGAADVSNIDINPAYTLFSDEVMAIRESPDCIPATFVQNLALSATATTSYVSPWESLAAIKDGFTPAGSGDRGHGVYGNWNNPNSFQWVQYEWPQSYLIHKTEVYWFDDNTGVRIPDTAYVEFWKDNAWTSLGSIPVQRDVFNILLPGSIRTNKIRLSMRNNVQSTGIIEWRVWGSDSALPAPGYHLLSFAGARTDGANQLQWETLAADSIAQYELEYGTDSIHFIKVATIEKNPAQSYRVTHASNSSNSYYRLRQVFLSGSSRYSAVVKISTVVENLAMQATASTSYVSPWETLGAVNDGFTPLHSGDKSHGAYGNWYNPDSLQWVAYEWPSNAVLDKAEIYWFDDGGGVRTPTTAYLEYWDGNAWVRVADVPLGKDSFNQVSLHNLNASRLRVVMKNNVESTGILEFRVWGYYSLPAAERLIVLHKDPASGKPVDNTLYNHLQVQNETGEAVPYKDISVRYWLTAEEYAAMTNLYTDYAQLGTGKVKMRYVKLAAPYEGAYGYLEYRFDSTAGSLAAYGNSGPIQTRAAKSTWTNFQKTNDYSYTPASAYTKNARITVYQNNVLVGGTEPLEIPVVKSLKVYSKNAGNNANTVAPWLKLNNEGNVPVNYADITMRYWFTAEGSSAVNYYLDYAAMGNAFVHGRIVKPASALNGADTYLELSFIAPDNLYPASTTGNIQQRMAKSDWSVFNQADDHSFRPEAAFGENAHITVYVKGELVYGTEPAPASVTLLATGKTASTSASADADFTVSLLQNPVPGNEVNVQVSGAAGRRLEMVLTDAAGRVLVTRSIQSASMVEKQRFLLQGAHAGIFFLTVNMDQQTKTVKVIRL